MSEQIYTQLREFMDKMPGGYPGTESGIEIRILKRLFSPGHAALMLNLKPVYEEASTIAQRIGMDKAKAEEKLEDMALGKRLLRLGYRVPALRGEDTAQVQMYTRQADLWNGLMRLGQGTLRFLGAGALLTAIFTTLTAEPLSVLAGKGKRRTRVKLAALSWVVVAAGFIPWARRQGSPWLALLAPVGAAMTICAAVLGLVRRLLGLGLQWKGRRV